MIKAPCIVLAAVTLNLLAARASDLRTISGKSVDLQPIHDWEENQKGERPLKHWKDIELVDWVDQGPHGHPVATIRIGAEQKKVWLKHCPKEVIRDFTKVVELERQLATAKQQALSANAEAEAAKIRASSGYSVAGDKAFVNAVLAQDQARADAAANAQAAATYAAGTVEKLNADLTLARAKLAADGKLLAMDTGTAFGSDPIWDTGLPGR